ncbi:MAG: hypothetical protein AAFR20_01505 [Pseudomonadota bacterium]
MKRNFWLIGVATLALSACGNGDDSGSKAGSGDSAVSSAALTAGKGSPFDKPFKLKSGEAFDVDGFLSAMGYDGPKPYGAAQFDDKLGATVLTDLRFDDGDGSIVTIEKAELFGVSEDAIEAVRSGQAAIDAPFETVFRKVRLYGVDVDVDTNKDGDEVDLSSGSDEIEFSQTGAGDLDDLTMTFGGVEIDTLKVRQGGIPDDLADAAAPAVFFNSFDLAGVYIKDANFAFSGEQTGALSWIAPDFRFVDIAGGKLGAIIVNDFEYSFRQSPEAMALALSSLGPQAEVLLNGPLGNILGLNGQRVKADTMTWKGIDFSGLMEWGLKGETPPTTATNLVSLGAGEIANYEQFIGDKRLMVAEKSTFAMDKFTWLIPNEITSDVKNAVYDLTAYVEDGDDATLTALTSRGLDNVKGDGFFEWNWNDKSGDSRLSYGGTTDKFADFDLSMALGNLKFEDIATLIDTQDQAGILGLGSFDQAKLTLTDKNLLAVIYDVAAGQMGAGTGEDLRQSAPALLRVSGSQFTSINPRFGGYLDALAAFLGAGGTLEISAAPDEAVPFAQLGIVSQTNPTTLPDVLNLTVTHKE